jgi:hypothetical protein
MMGTEPDEKPESIEGYLKKGPACTRCGYTGHSPKKCKRAILKEHCGKRCDHCADMAFRRDRPECLGCGKPWEPENVIHELPTPGSGCHGF